jgi:membrane protease YdiL (CAAX protease family)
MPTHPQQSEKRSKGENKMKTKTLVPFLAITFGLTWGLAALLFMFYDQIVAIFGELSMTNPLFILLVYSPGIAGIFLVWRHCGLGGLGSFLRRLTLWRAPGMWWLFLILGIPLIVYSGAALKGSVTEPFPFSPWCQVFPAMATALFIGPIEEFGWRGLALPLLQRKFSPFWAGLILGCIWGVWHIPAFLGSGTPQSAWDFGPYFIGIVAISIILTPLYNASRGSLLISVLYHFQIMNPVFPDAQPWDVLLFIIVAAFVVWLNRRTMFQRGSGVSDVLMPEESSLGLPDGPVDMGQPMESDRLAILVTDS